MIELKYWFRNKKITKGYRIDGKWYAIGKKNSLILLDYTPIRTWDKYESVERMARNNYKILPEVVCLTINKRKFHGELELNAGKSYRVNEDGIFYRSFGDYNRQITEKDLKPLTYAVKDGGGYATKLDDIVFMLNYKMRELKDIKKIIRNFKDYSVLDIVKLCNLENEIREQKCFIGRERKVIKF